LYQRQPQNGTDKNPFGDNAVAGDIRRTTINHLHRQLAALTKDRHTTTTTKILDDRSTTSICSRYRNVKRRFTVVTFIQQSAAAAADIPLFPTSNKASDRRVTIERLAVRKARHLAASGRGIIIERPYKPYRCPRVWKAVTDDTSGLQRRAIARVNTGYYVVNNGM
jgi:hypothetical protein